MVRPCMPKTTATRHLYQSSLMHHFGPKPLNNPLHSRIADNDDQFTRMLYFMQTESQILFCALFIQGGILRQLSDVLQKHASSATVRISTNGITFHIEEETGKIKRTVSVFLSVRDTRMYRLASDKDILIQMDTAPLHAITAQLKRKDRVMLYVNSHNIMGIVVDYIGTQIHTKHSTICIQILEHCENTGWHEMPASGIEIPSAVLQRMLREYRLLSKHVVFSGNEHYFEIRSVPGVGTLFFVRRSDDRRGIVPTNGAEPGRMTVGPRPILQEEMPDVHGVVFPAIEDQEGFGWRRTGQYHIRNIIIEHVRPYAP